MPRVIHTGKGPAIVDPKNGWSCGPGDMPKLLPKGASFNVTDAITAGVLKRVSDEDAARICAERKTPITPSTAALLERSSGAKPAATPVATVNPLPNDAAVPVEVVQAVKDVAATQEVDRGGVPKLKAVRALLTDRGYTGDVTVELRDKAWSALSTQTGTNAAESQ